MKTERHGLLLIDKPTGMTSHDVVGRVRKILGQKSVGHTGTLDPLATGLMILVLGEATKLSDYLTAADKSYVQKIKLGLTTDSLDRTGQVIREVKVDLPEETLRSAVARLEGEFDWAVPLFSAAKIDGKKLYEYGRKGEEVERPVKRMKFWDVQIRELGRDHLEVQLACSKGSFIRSWTSQLGENLGCGACVEELRRLTVGPWNVASSRTLEELEQGVEPGEAFVPMSRALPDLKPIVASPREMKLMSNGQIARDMVTRLIFEQKQAISTQTPVFVKVLTVAGDLLAILAAEPGQGLKIRRVFRYDT
jgi:tRNA pseudouridine55 synthase